MYTYNDYLYVHILKILNYKHALLSILQASYETVEHFLSSELTITLLETFNDAALLKDYTSFRLNYMKTTLLHSCTPAPAHRILASIVFLPAAADLQVLHPSTGS